MRIQVNRRVIEEIVVPDEVIVKECVESIKQDLFSDHPDYNFIEYVEDFTGGVEGYCKVLIEDVIHDKIWENPWWRDRTEVDDDVDNVEYIEDIEGRAALIKMLMKLIKGEE